MYQINKETLNRIRDLEPDGEVIPSMEKKERPYSDINGFLDYWFKRNWERKMSFERRFFDGEVSRTQYFSMNSNIEGSIYLLKRLDELKELVKDKVKRTPKRVY
jgi:hypothetical protein